MSRDKSRGTHKHRGPKLARGEHAKAAEEREAVARQANGRCVRTTLRGLIAVAGADPFVWMYPSGHEPGAAARARSDGVGRKPQLSTAADAAERRAQEPMPVLRSQIEQAHDERISNHDGMRFQGLAVILAKQRWLGFIACERKNDLGLDAYAAASLAPDGIAKGLACSITADLAKIADDSKKAQHNFPDVAVLIFATPQRVSNPKKEEWAKEIEKKFHYELHVMSREDIIASLMEPANVALCRSCLAIDVAIEAPIAEDIKRIRAAATQEAVKWAGT